MVSRGIGRRVKKSGGGFRQKYVASSVFLVSYLFRRLRVNSQFERLGREGDRCLITA